jgi:cell division protein FtsI/penicillin-binding protein 2
LWPPGQGECHRRRAGGQQQDGKQAAEGRPVVPCREATSEHETRVARHALPQAAVVMMEPSTGKILAYASRSQDGSTKDLNADAFAPSASVFKVVTGSALVQIANVSPDLKVCYSGGEQKITAADLKDDPKKDSWCATLAQAMGRSINTVFARLASRKLNGPDLHAIASQLGYGAPIPFDVPVTVSKIELPTDTLGFARTAAGFWNTTLSPLHGALLASTVGNGGVMMRPYLVTDVVDGNNMVYKTNAPVQLRKAIEPATAAAVEKMMTETVSQGTSYKAFHDAKGKAFLPGIEVAGKTGTLNNPQPVKLYTWFVGYAPTKNPKIAIATLVVNDPVWKVKANVVAREALQAFFAQSGAPGVKMPILE